MVLLPRLSKSTKRVLAIVLAIMMVLSSISPMASVSAAEIEEPKDQVLVNRGSTWKYLDDGSDQGTAWRGTDFDIVAGKKVPHRLAILKGRFMEISLQSKRSSGMVVTHKINMPPLISGQLSTWKMFQKLAAQV